MGTEEEFQELMSQIGAPTDLSETDENSSAYVKGVIRQENLPEGYPYKHEPIETTILSKDTYPVTYGYIETAISQCFQPNMTYIVNWDGTDYECSEFYELQNQQYIGNLSAAGVSGFTECQPFMMCTMDIGDEIVLFMQIASKSDIDTSASHVVEITEIKRMDTVIDSDLLPKITLLDLPSETIGVTNGAVRHDTAQTLSLLKQSQARANIGAAYNNQYGNYYNLSTDCIFGQFEATEDSLELDEIVYGDGVFVALTSNETDTIYRTTDNGDTWESVSLSKVAYWQKLTFFDDTFIAFESTDTNPSIIRSTDLGQTWECIDSTLDDIVDVICGDGIIIALTNGDEDTPYCMCSADKGSTWTTIEIPGNPVEYKNGVYGDGTFIITCIGNAKYSASADDFFAISNDKGVSWETVRIPVVSVRQICWTYINGIFIGRMLYPNTFIRSEDGGKSWRVDSPTLTSDFWANDIVSYGEMVIASDSTGYVYSTDYGATWKGANWHCYTDNKSIDIVRVNGKPAIGNGVMIAIADNNKSGDSQRNYILRGPCCSLGDYVTGVIAAYTPVSTLLTLSPDSWDSSLKTQTITVPGISADESSQFVQFTPASASTTAYNEANIRCTGRADDSLTFTCDTIPTENVNVYVMMTKVKKK